MLYSSSKCFYSSVEEKIKKKNPATPVAGFSIVLPIWCPSIIDSSKD